MKSKKKQKNTKKSEFRQISRKEYNLFLRNIDPSVCMLCPEESAGVKPIFELKYWKIVLPISPYFKNHTMLCTKRHVESISKLNIKEQEEFFKAHGKITKAYEKARIHRVRMQFHVRDKKAKKMKSNEHLHIHYYEFRKGDFDHLIPKTVHRQSTKRLLDGFY